MPWGQDFHQPSHLDCSRELGRETNENTSEGSFFFIVSFQYNESYCKRYFHVMVLYLIFCAIRNLKDLIMSLDRRLISLFPYLTN